MTAFRLFLIGFWLILAAYTLVVIINHGMGLLQIFFGDMAQMTWPGQFNLDFFGFLLLSGLWMAWRHHFSAGGLALGVLGVLGGMGVLPLYLLWALNDADGDMKIVMLGRQRATAS